MKSILNIVIVIALFSLTALFSFPGNPNYNYIFLLPVSVLALILISKHRLKFYKNSIVFHLLLFQIVIRYLIIPIFIAKEDIMLTGTNTLYGTETVFLMIIEILTVFAFLSFNATKQKIISENRNEIEEFIRPKIALIIVLAIVGFYIFISGYFNRVNYIWELQTYIDNKENLEEVSAFSGVLFYPLRIIISLMLFSYIYRSKLRRKKKVLLVILIIALNSIIIVGSSRFSIVLSVLPFFFIAYITFNKIKRYIVVGFLSILIPVIIITSLVKFATTSIISGSAPLVTGGILNAYFAGPGNVSTGIDLYYSKEAWPNTYFLFNDLFQNVPILSNYTDEKFKTNIFFNAKIYGHRLYQDQIVPLSLNGLIHFGVIGVFIYPLLFTWLAFSFEKRFFEEKYIGYKFVFITIAITLSLIFMLNIGSLVAAIFRNLFFLFIPLWVLRKMLILTKKR